MTVVKEKQKEQREQPLVRVYRETRAELRKVVWPARDETTRLTIAVIAISAAIGLFLFLGDTLFLWPYSLLVGVFQ